MASVTETTTSMPIAGRFPTVSRFGVWVGVQTMISSILAFASQLLIYDEVRWYRIDFFDSLVWGVVATQIFAMAYHTSATRIENWKESAWKFASFGVFAIGLTSAALLFLWREGFLDDEALPTVSYAGGHCLAVFVFLMTLFLHARLLLWCVHFVGKVIWPSSDVLPSDIDGADERLHYSMADVLAITGLAAVSIAGFRMTFRVMSENDTTRFFAMFYAASLLCLIAYGVLRSRFGFLFAFVIGLLMASLIAVGESQVAGQFETRRFPVRITPLLTWGWNVVVFLIGLVQLRIVDWVLGKPPS